MIVLYMTNVLGGENSLFAYLFPSLKEFFSSNEQTRITFYSMNSCPYCKKFQPEWERLVARVNDEGIVTQKFTVDDDPEEIETAKVDGFPTIRIHMNGKEIEYEGERTSDAIWKFVSGLKN
jgi:thiol-disulfide isomerase/thioredoxin